MLELMHRKIRLLMKFHKLNMTLKNEHFVICHFEKLLTFQRKFNHF